ncbi:MAG: hypothetical protein AB7F41_03890 [Methylocystis sp.]|uniref:hypothetical protein n=1 Tax=Methylocystis sp. TaxID=1911079 RepID=UPI003D1373D7
MISIAHHTELDYANLPHIDADGVGRLDHCDLACLDELGEFLVAVEASERFGVSLLHQHFAVRDGEMMVETVDGEAGLIRLRPERADESAQPILVRFSEADDRGNGLVALEFALNLGGVAPITSNDAQVLDGVRAILQRHAKLDRFGLRLIHDPLSAGLSSMLLETCDSRARILTCRAVDATDEALTQSVPTFFRWRDARIAPSGQLVVTQTIAAVCSVVRGCLSRPDGGHETHSSHEPGAV